MSKELDDLKRKAREAAYDLEEYWDKQMDKSGISNAVDDLEDYLETGRDNLEAGRDSLKTNWRKVKIDYKKLQNMHDGQPIDWLKAPWNGHHYVDMFKESAEHAPYLMGHIWAVYAPLSLLAVVLAWIH